MAHWKHSSYKPETHGHDLSSIHYQCRENDGDIEQHGPESPPGISESSKGFRNEHWIEDFEQEFTEEDEEAAAGREEAADPLQPLFETKEAGKGRVAYRIFAGTIMVAICAIWLYRIQQLIDDQGGRSGACIGMFMAELWFSFYWIINLPARLNVCHRSPFKERLSSRKGESGPEIGKQPSPKYEKGIGLHGPSNRVSKSPSTVKSFIDNMFLSDGVIKVQSGNSGMGRIIDIDGMNSTSSESSKEEFLSFSVEWEAYGEDNINQKMVSWILNDKIFNLAIKCYGMKHGSSKILNMGFSFGACFQWQGGEVS
ncbi:hypothetical protein LWI29_036790 [Acer saccharum]|uniref:Uncharacterized protein n=1 Tax=Acer saccharum TaxID=4024 RepID=A0AA39W575_ACESA|nr:hypothetical protein LWI29_036790 [Acer saccharum]